MGWELFDRDDASGFQICGVDGDALTEAPIASLPVGCEIEITAESAAPAVLAATEADLERVAASLRGRLVATSRTRTTLTSLVYLPSDDDADWFAKLALPRRASISVGPAIDPDWTLFDQARPRDIEEQSMFDFRVRTQLHEAGDIGGVRSIEHVVTGLAPDAAAAFQAAVSGALASVAVAADPQEPDTYAVTCPADPLDVTESSWIIRQIAERFAGSYDGWGCAVVTGMQRPQRAGRRWFRRS